MSQAQTFDEIYEFETQIEAAFKTLFAANEIVCLVQTDAADDFQKVRPRFELRYIHGSPAGHNRPRAPYYRVDSFVSMLEGKLVTNAKNTAGGGLQEHSRYRARIRNVMVKARAYFAANPTLLQFYTITDDLIETGTSPITAPENGVFESDIQFTFKVNVRPDSWPAVEE